MTRSRSSSAREARTFFTIGYSGRTIDAFVNALLGAGVVRVIDIRHMPVSRYRPEFSKRNLDERLASEGIRYVHERRLGIPSRIRREYGYPDHGGALWDWYDDNVLSREVVDASWVNDLGSGPVAMMCVESDATECHRHRLTGALQDQGLAYIGDL